MIEGRRGAKDPVARGVHLGRIFHDDEAFDRLDPDCARPVQCRDSSSGCAFLGQVGASGVGQARLALKKPIPFGKYLLLERINVGGMAEVFKAKAFGVEGFERLVAVKRILPSIAEDQEFITMFIDEAKIAVQLTHANVAQIFDLGKVGDSYFIAMEYVHGKDLRAIFDRTRKRGEALPVPMACYNVMKVCEGLDYAHNKKDAAGRDLNLVHRDVSPQNILISYDGEIKLIDFGIAKAANKAGKTQAGILKGKFGYMSPEQVRGLPLDRRSDIFSVGIVLYELLTGERLFVGESDFSTLEKVRNVEIMPPSTYNRRIPEELEQIVLKALAKDVDDRYQTAMDLHDDLQSFMYTSGNFFARKDLSAYMRKSFADEIAKETARDEEYRRLEAPGSSSSGLEAFDDLPPSKEQRLPARSPPPPPPRPQAPPQRQAANISHAGVTSSQASRRGGPKSTMMGLGVTPPPPPRVSNPGPPPPPPPRASHPGGLAAAPAPAPAPNAGPTLDMDWDDDELATQIYDKPDGELPDLGAVGAGLPNPAPPNAGAPSPFGASSAQGAPSPFSSSGYDSPTLPDPQPMGGAPSPFDLPPEPVPAPAPMPVIAPPGPAMPREATAVTSRAEPRRRGAWGALIAAAVVLLAGGAVGAWVLFAPEDPGTIHLTTVPTDPVVLFDERPVPATASPFVIANVEPGRTHLLEVSKTGFRTWSMQVEVQPGQTLQLPDVELTPSSGGAGAAAVAAGGTGFSLDTEPSGARVFVDGRELSTSTPITVTDLSAGSHTIRVEKGSRYMPWQTQIQVAEGQVVALPRAVLSLRSVEVSFRSNPAGARVVLTRGSSERLTVGTTPVTRDVDVTGDPWTVHMSRADHEEWSRELDIPSGREDFELTANLSASDAPPQVASAVRTPRTPPGPRVRPDPPDQADPTPPRPTPPAASGAPGTLRINTRPWSQVYVDGRLIGNTPQMNVSLSPGRHNVTLVNPDFNIRQSISVTIVSGQVNTKIITLTPGGG